MNYLKKLLLKLFGRTMDKTWPEPSALDRAMRPLAEQEKEHIEVLEVFQEVARGEAANIPNPEIILGIGASDHVKWVHKDDLEANFVVADQLVVDDIDFFIRYTDNKLTAEERDVFPPTFTQCFAAVNDVIMANLHFNMQEIKDDHYCFIVGIGNSVGLLLLRVEDSIDVIRRSSGIVDDEEKQNYVMQFMRFHEGAVERIGFCASPSEWPGAHPEMKLLVNFAEIEEPEEVVTPAEPTPEQLEDIINNPINVK